MHFQNCLVLLHVQSSIFKQNCQAKFSMIKDLIGLFANCWRMDRLIKLSKQGLVLPFYHVVSNQDLIPIKHL